MNTTTKSIIAKNLRYQLELHKMEQQELAQALGVHPSAVTQWLQEKTAPRASIIDKICKVFSITRADLLQDTDIKFHALAMSKTIPIYHSLYRDNKYFDESNIERYLAVDQSVYADFGIIVYSDSMSEAGINPGDIAFFTKDYKFVEGHIYAIWIMGRDSVILKRVYTTTNGYILNSENSNVAPIMIPNNEALIIGKLFGIYKEWRWD